jgi:hypothetical protein
MTGESRRVPGPSSVSGQDREKHSQELRKRRALGAILEREQRAGGRGRPGPAQPRRTIVESAWWTRRRALGREDEDVGASDGTAYMTRRPSVRKRGEDEWKGCGQESQIIRAVQSSISPTALTSSV